MAQTTIAKNIKRYRIKSKLTQAELGLLLDKGESTISMWESGAREPKMKTLERVASVLKVSISDLIGSPISPQITNPDQSANNIPVYGFTAAGTPIEALEVIQGSIEVPQQLIAQYGIDNLAALKVDGDSMNKIIPDGAIAVVAKNQTISNGEIAVVYYDGYNATLKTVYKTAENLLLEPASYNPENKPLIINSANQADVSFFGKLVFWCSDYNA
ncbi:MAG: LexA family protein [Culicoidibacterales bacterium]